MMRRAISPAIWRKSTFWPEGIRTTVVVRSFSVEDLGCQATRKRPGWYLKYSTVAAHGDPVHVDVGDGHEDRDLEHLLLEVLVLVDDLGHDDAAVAGCEGQVGVVDAHAAGFAEEGDDEEPEQQQQRGR